MDVSYSGVVYMGVTSLAKYHECHFKWFLLSFMRYTPVGMQREMTIGSLVHAALEGYYRSFLGMLDVHFATDEQRDLAREDGLRALSQLANTLAAEEGVPVDFDSWVTLAELIYTNYLAYGNPLFFKRVLEVEVPLEDKAAGVVIRGQADLIVEMDDGTKVVVDHKTRGAKMDDGKDLLTIDTQMQLYAYLAGRHLGKLPDAVMHNIIMRKEPTITVKKDGFPSTASTRLTWTTPDLMRDAIKNIPDASEEELVDLEKIVQGLEITVGDRFFQRVTVPVEEEVIEQAVMNAYLIGMDAWEKIEHLVRTGDPSKLTRNANTYTCKSCPLLEVCAADFRGDNVEVILQHNFIQRLTEDE